MHKEHLPSPWFRENFLNKITPGPNFWSKQSENWEKTRWKGHSQTPMTHFYQFGLKKKPEKGNVETVFQWRLSYLCTLVYHWFVHLCWTTWLGSAVVLYFKCFIYFALHGMCVLCAKLLQLGLFVTLCHSVSLWLSWLFVTPWTVARQAPLSMGFSRQECWSGLPCPPPEDLLHLKKWVDLVWILRVKFPVYSGLSLRENTF